MRRKHLMTALVCSVVLAASSVTPMAVMAEETELVTEAAEAEEETAAEESTEAQTEEALMEYPEYTASEYVELGAYKELVVVPESTEATDEEVEAELQSFVQMNAEKEILKEGTAENGDTVIIDYEGKKDGVAFDGGTAKDAELTLGSNTFIDGFEAGLVGVSVGETVDLNLTFPENYFSEDLAGAAVVFTVTVNEIQRAPELTDELISKLTNEEYKDIASYKDSIRKMIVEYKESMRESDILSKLLTQIADSSEIKSYPQVMVDYGVQNMENFYKEYAASYEMEYADFLSSFLGMTEEVFHEQAVMAVQQNLQQELYLKAIAEAEGMTVSEEEYADGCSRLAEVNGYESAEALVAEFGEDMVRSSILQEKVMEFLVDNAVIQEPETETETETEAVTEA